VVYFFLRESFFAGLIGWSMMFKDGMPSVIAIYILSSAGVIIIWFFFTLL
jgi:hypothetical protein